MLEELKKKGFRAMKPYVIACVIYSCIVLPFFWFLFGFHELPKEKANLNEMKDEEIGMRYVEADIDTIIGYYAGWRSSRKVEKGDMTEKAYIIPVGEASYIGLLAGKGKIEELDKIMKDTEDYLKGKRKEPPESIHLKGTILPLEGSSLRYYQEYCEAYYAGIENSEEEKREFKPYYLAVGYIGRGEWGMTAYIWCFCLSPLLLGVWQVVRNARGGNQKMIKAYCKKAPDYDRALKEVEQFYRKTARVQLLDSHVSGEFRISREFFMGPYRRKTLFLKSREILWAYYTDENHYSKGVKLYTLYVVKLMLRNGRRYRLAFSYAEDAMQILDRIRQTMPFVFIGKSKEMKKAYKKNRKELIEKADRIYENGPGSK